MDTARTNTPAGYPVRRSATSAWPLCICSFGHRALRASSIVFLSSLTRSLTLARCAKTPVRTEVQDWTTPPPHGPKDSISFFGKKSSLFHQKSIFQRDFTVTPYRPTATLCTPNNPPYTRDEPGTDCGRWGARFASLRFPRPPPTTTAHLHLPYTCTYTLPGPGSECYPLTPNVAFSEANSSVLVHF